MPLLHFLVHVAAERKYTLPLNMAKIISDLQSPIVPIVAKAPIFPACYSPHTNIPPIQPASPFAGWCFFVAIFEKTALPRRQRYFYTNSGQVPVKGLKARC